MPTPTYPKLAPGTKVKFQVFVGKDFNNQVPKGLGDIITVDADGTVHRSDYFTQDANCRVISNAPRVVISLWDGREIDITENVTLRYVAAEG